MVLNTFFFLKITVFLEPFILWFLPQPHMGAAWGHRCAYHDLSVQRELTATKEVRDVTKIINKREQEKKNAETPKGNSSLLLDKVLFEVDLESLLKVMKPTHCGQDAWKEWVIRNHASCLT